MYRQVSLLLLLLAASVSAGQFQVEYSFNQPTVDKVAIQGATYDRVAMPGLSNGGEIGHPWLPEAPARILIPYGEEVESIDVVTGPRQSLGEGYFVEPTARPVRLSADPWDVPALVADSAVYSMTAGYPADRMTAVTLQTFRGHTIQHLKLSPMEFVPSTGELGWFESLTVIVKTRASGKGAPMFRGGSVDESEAAARVDNPGVLATYAAAPGRGTRGYDLLIITADAWVGAFQQLKDYHDTTGIATEIHTLTAIGSSDPDAVRDHIRTEYQDNGIQYVLIGGDDDIIPAKDLYVRSSSGAGADEEYDMPGDIYFACLDGTWNYDGDDKVGEPNDGENGQSIDLTAEVYVGRACVGDFIEADRFVRKTIRYDTTTSYYLQQALLVGEYLGFGGVAEYAGGMMDQLVGEVDEDGYATVGWSEDRYDIDRLYDRDALNHDWSKSELISRVNAGMNLINHLGHGNPGWAMKMTSTEASTQFTSQNLSLLYSQTCLAGHFDGTDCWAEHGTIKSEYGFAAIIMNSRYGYGTYFSTDGPSHRFNREFWDAVYNPAENIPQMGRANQDAKEDNLYRINQACMRWVYYESNLFGDPTLKVKDGGVAFSVDTELGWAPLDVQFEAASYLDVQTWTWFFGDGTESHEQSPNHTYATAGLYDVTVQVETAEETRSRTRSQYVAVLDDSLRAEEVPAVPGGLIAFPVYARNTIPLYEINIPVEYSGELALVFDTFMTYGCRTAGFDEEYLHASATSRMVTLKIAAGDGVEPLPPGEGQIAWLYFHTEGTPVIGQASDIILDGYGLITPRFAGDRGEYQPRIHSGRIAYLSCCAGQRDDVDQSGYLDIGDVVYLVNYMFKEGTEPPCMEEADTDASGFVDIGDLVYLVNYMFKYGLEPLPCQMP